MGLSFPDTDEKVIHRNRPFAMNLCGVKALTDEIGGGNKSGKFGSHKVGQGDLYFENYKRNGRDWILLSEVRKPSFLL